MTKPRDKSAKFKELATTRTRNAIKAIRLIGNLANKANYEYSSEESSRILRALRTELKALQQSFDSGGKKEGIDFTL